MRVYRTDNLYATEMSIHWVFGHGCVCSELGVDDLSRRVLVTLWQTSDNDPQMDRLIGATSFGVLNVACNKTVSTPKYRKFSELLARWRLNKVAS